MATQEDLRKVAGKALADPEFRQKLMDDPEAALQEAGIQLSEEQMKALKEMDKEQFEAGLAELDQRLTMGCWGYVGIPGPSTPKIEGLPGVAAPTTCVKATCVWL